MNRKRDRLLPELVRKSGPAHEDGKPICKWCKGPLEGRRRTFCSDSCVHEWNLRTSVSYLRSQVFFRDKGKCAKCGQDTTGLRKELAELPPESRKARLDSLGISEKQYLRSLWEADHILPVAQGGGWSGMSNIQTLCIWCHRDKTYKRTT